jgi:esterase/lipase superfamily enzyme
MSTEARQQGIRRKDLPSYDGGRSWAGAVGRTVRCAAVALLVTACASQPTGVLEPVSDTVPTTSRVNMLVATTRSRSADPGEMFTGERGAAHAFAAITVSIPEQRKVGEVAWPKKLPADPRTDFATLEAIELDREGAIARLNQAIHVSPDRSVLVFIHGFNNRFEDSVYRFAQIVHDSRTRSVPILVTWPSRGSVRAYGYDRESTNYSRNSLEDLFQFLDRDQDVKEVSILAHSMGNWLALESLRQMAIRNGRLPAKFKNIMLAAPDVDVDVFRSQIDDMGSPRPQFTLFVSQDDRALKVSRRVWGDVSRLGAIDAEQEPYRQEMARNEITVIDMTKVKGGDKLHHDKFASSPEIVQLIGARISEGQTLTDSRVGLGEHIIAATTNAAAAVGNTAGLVIAAPVAAVDQDTRANYGNHLAGITGAPGGNNAAACISPDPATGKCPQ